MARRNPPATTFIRNFNATRLVSNWGRDIDMAPDNVVRPLSFAIGQADNMMASYKQALRRQQAVDALASLDGLGSLSHTPPDVDKRLESLDEYRAENWLYNL